ncbi:uncharacterized protein DSM5745_00778 [Aspergillus mulundensis]|uniref:Myb-like domain-containing protein n=1 Tax=Aspergillus mulundensis TaxID=1810919 RepID=A0A3D8T4H4_9EURO|nr:hypothetical protein DSM5745_00778 [Aspergillus mulundensis]RDW93456.1 hypothetical protein DSM5745_00778 [Aspergillus mulundensis]
MSFPRRNNFGEEWTDEENARLWHFRKKYPEITWLEFHQGNFIPNRTYDAIRRKWYAMTHETPEKRFGEEIMVGQKSKIPRVCDSDDIDAESDAEAGDINPNGEVNPVSGHASSGSCLSLTNGQFSFHQKATGVLVSTEKDSAMGVTAHIQKTDSSLPVKFELPANHRPSENRPRHRKIAKTKRPVKSADNPFQQFRRMSLSPEPPLLTGPAMLISQRACQADQKTSTTYLPQKPPNAHLNDPGQHDPRAPMCAPTRSPWVPRQLMNCQRKTSSPLLSEPVSSHSLPDISLKEAKTQPNIYDGPSLDPRKRIARRSVELPDLTPQGARLKSSPPSTVTPSFPNEPGNVDSTLQPYLDQGSTRVSVMELLQRLQHRLATEHVMLEDQIKTMEGKAKVTEESYKQVEAMRHKLEQPQNLVLPDLVTLYGFVELAESMGLSHAPPMNRPDSSIDASQPDRVVKQSIESEDDAN